MKKAKPEYPWHKMAWNAAVNLGMIGMAVYWMGGFSAIWSLVSGLHNLRGVGFGAICGTALFLWWIGSYIWANVSEHFQEQRKVIEAAKAEFQDAVSSTDALPRPAGASGPGELLRPAGAAPPELALLLRSTGGAAVASCMASSGHDAEPRMLNSAT